MEMLSGGLIGFVLAFGMVLGSLNGKLKRIEAKQTEHGTSLVKIRERQVVHSYRFLRLEAAVGNGKPLPEITPDT
jgi:hypothetical protein